MKNINYVLTSLHHDDRGAAFALLVFKLFNISVIILINLKFYFFFLQLEVLHGNLHLKLEAQSIKEQFLSLLESFSEYEDKFIGNGCPLFAPSPIKNTEGVAAARARVRTLYEARRVSINARRLRMQGLSPRKLQFSSKKGKYTHSSKDNLHKRLAHKKTGTSNETSLWTTPAVKRNRNMPEIQEGTLNLSDISAINTMGESPTPLKPSPTWGPLHSTVLDDPTTEQITKLKRQARSSSDGNVSRSGRKMSQKSLRKCMERTYSQSCCECNSLLRDTSNLSYSSQVYRNRGPVPDDIFTQQCDMLENMRVKIRQLEHQILRKPSKGANLTQSTCSTCSCDSYANKENMYRSLAESTPCNIQPSRKLSEFGSYTDLSDISSCSSPKKRKRDDRRNLSDSELYSSVNGSLHVSPITNQFSALDLSAPLYNSMVETPIRKSFRVPSLLINFDQNDGLPSASLLSRTPSGESESDPPTSTSTSSRVSSFVSTPLYPSTAHVTSEEEAENPIKSDPHSDPMSDQDKTIMCPTTHSDPDVTIRSNVVTFNISPPTSPASRLRRQVGQSKLEAEHMREPLGLTMSDLQDNTCTSSNMAEVTGSGGYTSLGATCASSPNFSEFGSQTSDSSLGSIDITESIFPNNARRAGSHSSFKESDGFWSDSSLNATVRAKPRHSITPAQSHNDLLVPVNSPNATNSSGSSRPTTDSNDKVDIMEFDYQKVRSQMAYRPRRHLTRASPVGKHASPVDDTNNNQVRQKYRSGPPPARSSAFGRQNQQNIPPSSRNIRQKKTPTDGDSGFSTQNSQYANERALAYSHQSVYSQHSTTSSTTTSTRTAISHHRKKQVVKRMKQYSSAMHVNMRKISGSKSSLQSLGYV